MSAPQVPPNLPLSLDGLRYTAQEYESLSQLSTLNLETLDTTPAEEVRAVLQGLTETAMGLLTNPRIEQPVDMADITRQLAEAVHEANCYQDQLATIREELNHERANSAALRSNATRTTSHPNPTITVPDPERFDGTKDKLRSFVSHLNMKLQIDAARFPTDQHQLCYTMGLLTGQAFAQVEPYIKPTFVDLANVKALTDILETAFGDPDRETTAERKLESLRQSNKDFSTYYAEFQRYAADVKWNAAAKRTALTRGLSNEIKDALITADTIPTEFTSYVTYIQRLDNRIRAREAEKKSRFTPRSNPAPTPVRPAHAPAPVHAPVPAPTNAPVRTAYPDAMDLSSGRPKLTDEERRKRLQEGRCYYCGGFGHNIRNCPNKPVRANEAVLATPNADGTTATPQPAEN
jgi:hypothetical protein